MDNINILRDNKNKEISVDSGIDNHQDENEFEMKFTGGTEESSMEDNGLDFMMNDESKKDCGPSRLQEKFQEESVNSSGGEDAEDDENDNESAFENGNETSPEEEYINVKHVEPKPPKMTYQEVQEEKSMYLAKLKRLSNNTNVIARKFNSSNSLEEIKGEFFRIKKEIEINAGIDYCKKGLMFFVNTIEMGSGYIMEDGLTGWSKTVMNDVNNNSYDLVLEELYEKYSKNAKMSPEIKLISMIAGSAFMFHLQKGLVHKGMNDPNMLSKLMNKFGGTEKKQSEMKGPSIKVDDLLSRLDADDISDVSSVVSDEESPPIKITKKRGRKPKAK
jgi:hypothetical protein